MSATPKSQDDICQRCLYTRWAHENARDVLPEMCANFEEPAAVDPLLAEPDFDFAAFRKFCEETNVDMAHADVAFVMWLHTQAHTAKA